jgi:hypothetical protein
MKCMAGGGEWYHGRSMDEMVDEGDGGVGGDALGGIGSGREICMQVLSLFTYIRLCNFYAYMCWRCQSSGWKMLAWGSTIITRTRTLGSAWLGIRGPCRQSWQRWVVSRRRGVHPSKMYMWRVQSCNNTLQDILHVLVVTKSNSCFSIGTNYNVGTSLMQFSEGSDAYCTTNTSRYVQLRTVNLTHHMTRQKRFLMQNMVPHARRAAPLSLLTMVGKPERLTRKRVYTSVSYLGGKLYKPSAVEGGDKTI